MRAAVEFVTGQNVISSSCPFDVETCASAAFAISLLVDGIFLVVLFNAVHVLSGSFTYEALESMSLQKGRRSEMVAIIVRSFVIALPEISLSALLMIDNERPVDVGTISSAIIQGGWISMLLIPGLLSIRRGISVPITLLLRSVTAISIALSAWTLLLPTIGVSPIMCMTLVTIYTLYVISVWRTLWIQQEERDLKRESRLMVQLAPMVETTDTADLFSAVPVQLVGPVEESPIFVTLGTPEYQRLANSIEEVKHCSTSERLLSYVCVRAIPGTSSERLYIISLINSFVLELALTVFAFSLCERLMAGLVSGSVMEPFRAIILAILSKMSQLIPACSSCIEPRILIESLDAHVVGLTIGSGLPWASAILIGGVQSFSLTINAVDISCSVVSLCLLCGISVCCVCKSQKALYTQLGVSEGKLLLASYACIISTAALLHYMTY